MSYREINKCHGCLFLGSFQDMGASTPICTRTRGGLAEAIEAYKADQVCPWHITKSDIIRMQDAAAFKAHAAEVQALNTGRGAVDLAQIAKKITDGILAGFNSEFGIKTTEEGLS